MSTPTKSTLLACLTAQASAGGLPGYNIKFPLIEPDRADSFFPIKNLKDAAIKNGETFDEKKLKKKIIKKANEAKIDKISSKI